MDRPGGGDEPVARETRTYMTDQQAETLCQVFAEGLDSGVGYARIFDMLERNDFDSTNVDRMRRAVLDEGDQLGEAFARHGILDPTARKLVLVAERQGTLPETFDHLGEFYGLRHKRKKRFVYTMVEPAILIALGGILLVNLLTADLVGITMAPDTRARLVQLFIDSGIQIAFFGLTAFASAFVWLNLPVDFTPRDLASRLWLRAPVLSEPNRLHSISRFCRFLKQGIASGIDVYRSLALASEASNNPKLLAQTERARQRLDRGDSLADALFVAEELPDEVIEQIEIGEESGRLQERLGYLADRYYERATERFDRQMEVIVAVIRYGIILFVIALVLYAAVQMMSML